MGRNSTFDSPVTHHVSRITFHASRITFHASRITFHASRFTHHASRFTHHVSRITFHASFITLTVPVPPDTSRDRRPCTNNPTRCRTTKAASPCFLRARSCTAHPISTNESYRENRPILKALPTTEVCLEADLRRPSSLPRSLRLCSCSWRLQQRSPQSKRSESELVTRCHRACPSAPATPVLSLSQRRSSSE